VRVFSVSDVPACGASYAGAKAGTPLIEVPLLMRLVARLVWVPADAAAAASAAGASLLGRLLVFEKPASTQFSRRIKAWAVPLFQTESSQRLSAGTPVDFHALVASPVAALRPERDAVSSGVLGGLRVRPQVYSETGKAGAADTNENAVSSFNNGTDDDSLQVIAFRIVDQRAGESIASVAHDRKTQLTRVYAHLLVRKPPSHGFNKAYALAGSGNGARAMGMAEGNTVATGSGIPAGQEACVIISSRLLPSIPSDQRSNIVASTDKLSSRSASANTLCSDLTALGVDLATLRAAAMSAIPNDDAEIPMLSPVGRSTASEHLYVANISHKGPIDLVALLDKGASAAQPEAGGRSTRIQMVREDLKRTFTAGPAIARSHTGGSAAVIDVLETHTPSSVAGSPYLDDILSAEIEAADALAHAKAAMALKSAQAVLQRAARPGAALLAEPEARAVYQAIDRARQTLALLSRP
jgi:hypothetical protein